MTAPTAAAVAGVLEVGPTGRYLIDAGGAPFLLHGEAAWSLAAALRREEAASYVDDRAARGFNALIVNAVEHRFAPDAPRNRYGDEPFREPGNLATPNDRYFEHLDWLVEHAARRGLLVLLAPCYLGYPQPGNPLFNADGAPEGWYGEVLASGVDACEAYGAFLGDRYARAENILWVIGGDRNPGDAREHMRALVRGIRRHDRRHLITAHVLPEHSPLDEYPEDPWLSVNATYTYGIVHRQVLRDYRRDPPRPTFLVESTYENEHNASDVQIRRQAYWALLCGASGQCVGNFPLWHFADGWRAELDSPGTSAMGHLKRLFARLPWWELVPDERHELVVSGVGELRGLDTCCTARTPDRRLAVAYMPSARVIEVDLARLAGERAHVTWFDPVRGESHDPVAVPAEGVRPFTPPGEQDWALVMRAG